jgi:hypothetical protein
MDKSKQKRSNNQSSSKPYPTETIGPAQHLIEAWLNVSPVEKFFGESCRNNQATHDERKMGN